MAMLPNTFKTSDVSNSVDIIPPGEYVCHVTRSELKDNKKGTGKYLSFTIQVIEGEHKGFTLFDIMNVVHENKRAEEIGNRNFKNLVEACGLTEIEDTTELHGIPFIAVVATEPAQNGYPEKSKVKKYLPEA